VAGYSSLLTTCYNRDTLPRALPHLNKANWRYHSFAAKPNGEARANKRRDEQRSEQSEVEYLTTVFRDVSKKQLHSAVP
jgi:hypothetical protein